MTLFVVCSMLSPTCGGICFLGTSSELLQLQAKHIHVGKSSSIVLHLGSTKMSYRNAGAAATTLENLEVSMLLRAWLLRACPDDFLVDLRPHAFRARVWFYKLPV